MARENRTRYALLGALSLGQKSGYDLQKEFEQRMGHFWAESLGQIYPTLHRLRAEKLVAAREDRTGAGRARTLYRLTQAGQRALSDWLAQPPEPVSVRSELLLKLFFGTELGVDGAIRHLEGFENELVEQGRRYEAMADEIDDQASTEEQRIFWNIALLSGKEVRDARLRWCRRAQRELHDFAGRQPSANRRGKGRAAR